MPEYAWICSHLQITPKLHSLLTAHGSGSRGSPALTRSPLILPWCSGYISLLALMSHKSYSSLHASNHASNPARIAQRLAARKKEGGRSQSRRGLRLRPWKARPRLVPRAPSAAELPSLRCRCPDEAWESLQRGRGGGAKGPFKGKTSTEGAKMDVIAQENQHGHRSSRCYSCVTMACARHVVQCSPTCQRQWQKSRE